MKSLLTRKNKNEIFNLIYMELYTMVHSSIDIYYL